MGDEQNKKGNSKTLVEFAFKELKEDIREFKDDFRLDLRALQEEFKQFRRDIFGNGKPGMCTKRQEILKNWIIEREKIGNERSLVREKAIKERVEDIEKTPAKIYNLVWKILALIGMIGSGIGFFLNYFQLR